MSPMTGAEQERIFRDKELEFFGAVTASLSHDMNNAIAIIEQTAGLLEDLISVGASQSVTKDQLQRIVDRIGKQTKRGAMIVRRLNAFAHSVEAAKREIELNDLTDCVIALARRKAERRRTELVARPAAGRIVISANPFRVQEALYLSIQKAVSSLPEGSRLEIGAEGDDVNAWISVEGEPPGSSTELDLSYLEMLMGQLGGKLESDVGDGRLLIRLTFPMS